MTLWIDIVCLLFSMYGAFAFIRDCLHEFKKDEKVVEEKADEQINKTYRMYLERIWKLQHELGIERARTERYKECLEELGAKICTEKSTQFSPDSPLGHKELERVRIQYDKSFIIEKPIFCFKGERDDK